ncbi:hypothetical protein D1609_13545 [Leptospira borgpetersenii serovar Hardjo-bovis]|nr:hypothetical protein D1609_13545 [Leptospira borgpetersenii serovar Hardjo-bovis]
MSFRIFQGELIWRPIRSSTSFFAYFLNPPIIYIVREKHSRRLIRLIFAGWKDNLYIGSCS